MIEPQEVTDLDLAFPAYVMGSLLPNWGDIPAEYKSGNRWAVLANHIFYKGGEDVAIKVKEGVDRRKAKRHLMACLGSYQPNHEHKIAGVAWLMSQWFDDYELPKKEPA